MRVISMEQGGNLKGTFERFCRGLQEVCLFIHMLVLQNLLLIFVCVSDLYISAVYNCVPLEINELLDCTTGKT